MSNYGHSTTLVGIPAELLASVDFNANPSDLHIGGTRDANRSLFASLNACATLAEAGACFQDTMDVMFGFEPEQRMAVDAYGRRRFRSSYLRLLKGWAFDANGAEAAVLKGWVESRFGLYPTFHGNVIVPSSSRDWIAYVDQKMNSRFHNNAINLQLDMLYEFCQWALRRFFAPNLRHLVLYRGTNDFSEHPVIKRIDRRNAIVRLNNLVSFTRDRDLACEFGDYILQAHVPLTKIIFFNTLLPLHALRGEAEYLVIGGDYRVKVSTL